jgi:hypothetical protein
LANLWTTCFDYCWVWFIQGTLESLANDRDSIRIDITYSLKFIERNK